MLDKYHVNKDTIGQYTGFKDTHGKKVFEQDIINIFGSIATNDVIGVVMWCNHDQCYVVVKATNQIEENIHLTDLGNLSFPDYFEVIGNIHDNQELLKEDN